MVGTASAGAEHTSAVVAVRAHLAAVEGDGTQAGACIFTLTHRGHGAAAVEVVSHQAIVHHNGGVASDEACGQAQLIAFVFIDASTAAIHVAVKDARSGAVLIGKVLRLGEGLAYGAAFKEHIGRSQHVAVFAAAEYRAADEGVAIDGDMGVVHVGQAFVG